MDSMSSNLKATLPLNVDEDPELLNLFKGRRLYLLFFSTYWNQPLLTPSSRNPKSDSALSISSLFKHAQFSRRQTFANGYGTAITDIVDYVQAAGKSQIPSPPPSAAHPSYKPFFDSQRRREGPHYHRRYNILPRATSASPSEGPRPVFHDRQAAACLAHQH